MIRYENQPLPPRPRIAVIANDALGNFVMATPVMQLLRAERSPASIEFFGGTRTRELQEASDLFERSHLLHGGSMPEILEVLSASSDFDLVVNLESTSLSKVATGLISGPQTLVAGPCMGQGGRGDLPHSVDSRGDLWRDAAWAGAGIERKYPFLKSGFISEIFCRLLYLEGEIPPYRVAARQPDIPIPDILIATAASLTEKLWPAGKWREFVQKLRERGLTVGLLGAPPAVQQLHWTGGEAEEEFLGPELAVDLRGKLTLPEVVGALRAARAVATLDNGILHLAVAAGAATVGLYRHGIHRLWAPPCANLDVLTPGEGNDVAEISVEAVLSKLELRLA